jgi:Kef-type K+ transport system membrane component KefB
MEIHHTLLVLGGLLLLGLVADELGRRTRIPRITLLILLGFAIGPSGFDVLPKAFQDWYPFLATVALTMVAFLLGSNLSVDALRKHGREILSVSLTVVGVTVFVVALGLAVLGVSILLSFILAGIATATAPAASQDVVRQTGASGPFTDTLLGVVAIDDAWGLIVFSILLVIAKAFVGEGAMSILLHGLWEVGGAFLVGAAVGLPAAFLTGRLQEGEPIQAEALGIVFVCAGLAIWLGVSFLLAGIVAGIIVVNLAQHHNRAFHEIEHVEWPFMVLFFIISGAMLHLDGLHAHGLYRFAHRISRSWWLARCDPCRGTHAAPALDRNCAATTSRRCTWHGVDRWVPPAGYEGNAAGDRHRLDRRLRNRWTGPDAAGALQGRGSTMTSM